jgi:hypothetical protein
MIELSCLRGSEIYEACDDEMPAKGHAILSASSADRWLHCPPSARLCEIYDDKGSDYAAEGTDAHALCEYKLRRALGMEAKDPTMNISIANDTCTGLTAIPTSTVDAAGNAGIKQVETLTVSGSVSYNWTYNLYYQSFPTRDGQSFGSTFFLGKTVPGLKFTTPPAAGA